jgi:Domain of unknown function (DUF4402)
MRAARSAFVAVAILVAGAGQLRAQLVAATGIRDLGFGDVLPGVPNTVQPTDATRSGQFDILGPNLAQVEITFGLPTALTAGGGGTMPVSFSATSAGYSANGSIGSQVAFDPRVPYRANLSLLGRGSAFIGGSLAPPGTQAAGTYSGPLSVTVALVGL